MGNNKVMYIIIGVIVLLIILFVGYRYLSSDKNDSARQELSSQDTANNQESDGSMDNSEETKLNTDSSTGECVRDFNPETLANAKIDTKNKFVTLSVAKFGDIKLELFDQDAPKTVENFLRLVNSGYYNCLTFHRVAQGFVIQGGDPKGDGTGGESAYSADFADELNPNTQSFKTGYVKGTLAMANRGPDTNGSQFFITLDDLNGALPKNYTIFGKVIAGQEVVDKIGQVEVEPGPFGGSDGQPLEKITINKAVITDK